MVVSNRGGFHDLQPVVTRLAIVGACIDLVSLFLVAECGAAEISDYASGADDVLSCGGPIRLVVVVLDAVETPIELAYCDDAVGVLSRLCYLGV